MQASFAALQSQVTALNAQLAQMVNTHKSVDPSGFNRLAKAAETNSRVFRDAAASTGLFETQQVRVNSATDEYVKKLNAQKMSFRDMMRQRKIATAAYREQLAMENMVVRKNPASSMHGKDVFDVTYPKAYEAALDNTGNKLRWFNAQLKSGSHQMVNWGKNTQWAGRQMMVGLTMPVVAFGAAAGVMAFKVDKEFTRIAKVYDTHANRLEDLAGWEKETAELRAQGFDTARLAAREYQAAMTDTLEVQAELAATGKTGADLQRTTAEVMRISTLGELDKNTATEATIALQSIWRMSNEELTDSFNYLNAIENATSLSTQDFATAIPIAGATIKAFGGDVKELGILLTAMKERGINASQGANALKATMQRLARPSKQVQAEFEALTGHDITAIVDESENLTDVFRQLSTITKDMGGAERRKVFAGLFGSYQVTRLMAVTEGVRELDEGIGQVSDAARVAGQSTSSWAETARGEVEALQKSVSGRFKSAVEEMKIILAEMGMPFLEAATTVLETLAKIGGFINDMPDFAKKALGWTIAIAAMAGPVVMLTGLLANLLGTGGKVLAGIIGGFAKMAGTMGILDKQSRIYQASAKMAETQHLTHTKAVRDLTTTMNALVASQKAANTASQKAAAAEHVQIKSSAARKKIEDERIRQMQIQNRLMSEYAILNKNDKIQYMSGNRFLSEGAARALATADVDTMNAKQIADAAKAEAMAKSATAESSKAAAAAAAKHKVHMRAAAISGGLMSASMAAMMLPLGDTASKIAQFTMIGTIVLPAAWSLAGVMGKVALSAKSYSKNMWSAAAATNAAAAGSTKAATAGAGSNFMAMLKGAKGNIIGSALIAAGYGAYKIWDHFRDIRVEQEKIDENNAKLLSQTERWASAANKTVDGYKKLAALSRTGVDTADMSKRVSFYKSDDEKAATESFNDMGWAQQRVQMQDMYIDMVQGMGMKPKQAMKEMQAFLIATGRSYLSAAASAETFAGSVKHVGAEASKQTQAGVWMAQFESTAKTIQGLDLKTQDDAAAAMGESAGKSWSQAFILGNKNTRMQMEANLRTTVHEPWKKIVSEMKADASMRPDMAAMNNQTMADALGISVEDWEEATDSGEKFRTFYMSLDSDMRETLKGLTPFDDAIAQAEVLERAIVGGIAKALGTAGSDVDTLGELFNDAAVAAETLASRVGKGIFLNIDTGHFERTTNELQVAMSDIGRLYEDFMGKRFDPKDIKEFEAALVDLQTTNTSDMTEEEKKAYDEQRAALEDLITTLYAYAQAKGIKTGDTEFETIINLFNGTTVAADRAKDKITAVKSELDKIKSKRISIDVIVNSFQDIRSGIQNTMADMMTNDFERRQEADMDAANSYWDGRKEALDNEMERRSAGLDAKWEKRKDGAEKYWDARIEGVKKAIEAEEKAEDKRQKIFDAEMERMDRLTENANRNIDFNVALNSGNLDEAAKIANEAESATANFALENAAKASEEASKKKIDRLNDRTDDLEQQRDLAMKAMEKREKAEKAHLEKVSSMRKKALENDADAAIKAKQQDWELRKVAFDEQMALFLAFTARNDKELKEHMKAVGISYDDFGGILKAKGTDWSTFMGEEMKKQVTAAGYKLRDDAVWSQLGKGAVDGILDAMGFSSMKQFQNFVKTGEMVNYPDETSPNGANTGKQGKTKGGRGPASENKRSPNPRHTGGWVDGKQGSRKGVARNYKGVHPSEQMMLLRKNEYVVNEDAAQRHGPLLEAINNGKSTPMHGGYENPPAKNKKGIGGGGVGFGGFVAGAMQAMLMKGVAKAMENKHSETVSRVAAQATTGRFSAAGAGKYGDVSFSADQLANASTIASVGSQMGMSARDIQIGIMTAIAESMLRNVNYGDRDSLGLFQQRPSMGWGTPEQVRDPEYAARKFFESLKKVDNRASMSPWMAAQTVQRSAFADGSNYATYWDEADAIYRAMGRTPGGGGTAQYKSGPGGWHYPAPRGKGWANSHDYRAPGGTPLYAVSDGTIIDSRSIRSGGSSTYPGYPAGYTSYGETVAMRTASGDVFRYAHLTPGTRIGLGPVKGGTMVGKSGMTGNASGYHVHFDVNGNYNASGWLAGKGLSLNKGAANINFDNTLANLHKGEAVLTEDINRQFKQGVENFANGPSVVYDIDVEVNGANKDVKDLAREVVKIIRTEEARKPVNRTVGRKR